MTTYVHDHNHDQKHAQEHYHDHDWGVSAGVSVLRKPPIGLGGGIGVAVKCSPATLDIVAA